MENHLNATADYAACGPGKKKSAVLFVLPWSLIHAGGVNQVVINLARQFRDAQIEPIVLTPDWDAINPVWETIHGVRTIRWRIRVFEFQLSIKNRILYWLWEGSFRRRFDAFCSDNKVLALNMHYVGPVAFTLDRIRKSPQRTIPLYLSFHGTDLKTLSGLSKAAIARWVQLLRGVTGVVVCSRDLGERFSSLFGRSIATCVIHNGLDAGAFSAAASVQPQPIESRYILTVGKFERQKGQDVLIEAFAEISPDYPDVNLVLVGATSDALDSLKELCKRLGISARVRFYQDRPHDEMAGFFRYADLFILPSRLEAFPIVLLEAGALGLPVVATQVGGIPELITDGFTGRLVPPDDSVKLASAIRSILDDSLASVNMGSRLRDHVSSNFTWKIAGDRYRYILLGR